MCLAVPMKIISIADDMAVAEIDGVRREASLMMLDEDAGIGDYVLIHAGFAISKLDEEAALETIALMRECLALGQETSNGKVHSWKAGEQTSEIVLDGLGIPAGQGNEIYLKLGIVRAPGVLGQLGPADPLGDGTDPSITPEDLRNHLSQTQRFLKRGAGDHRHVDEVMPLAELGQKCRPKKWQG